MVDGDEAFVAGGPEDIRKGLRSEWGILDTPIVELNGGRAAGEADCDGGRGGEGGVMDRRSEGMEEGGDRGYDEGAVRRSVSGCLAGVHG